MRIALIDATPRAPVYSVALLKIGAWRRSLGDECELFENALPMPKENGFDEAWISGVFTYHVPNMLKLAKAARAVAKRIRIGGVAATLIPEYFEDRGFEVYKGLIPDAEKFGPDYSLLAKKPTYSITHTSRGCVRRCKFCMVSKLEPEFTNRERWEEDLAPGARRILFYDNNWLAKKYEDLKKDANAIKKLYADGRIGKVDFNQGLDCRLLTEKKADLFCGLPIYPVRFAFDNMSQDGHFQKAIRMLRERGQRDFSFYVLYNYKDTPEDFYYRIKLCAQLREEEDKGDFMAFPMRYQPILEINRGRDFVGDHWTRRKLKNFMAILSSHSVDGQISPRGGCTMSPMEEFEYMFGKDAAEFNHLLAFPKGRKLVKRKKERLRIARMVQRKEMEQNQAKSGEMAG